MPTVFVSGPVNIQQGNTASFVVEFLDANGAYATPSGGGVIDISYLDTVGQSVTETVTLSAANNFFTGSWASTPAALGLATWVATTIGSTVVAATGQLRIIDRQG